MKKCNEHLNIDIQKWTTLVRTVSQKIKIEIAGMDGKVRLLFQTLPELFTYRIGTPPESKILYKIYVDSDLDLKCFRS